MVAQGAAAAALVSCRESEVQREKRDDKYVWEYFTWLRMNENYLADFLSLQKYLFAN